MRPDRDAPLRFLRTAFELDDWIAILLKAHGTGEAVQRVAPVSVVATPRFQSWLRARNADGLSIFVGVNAITPRARTRRRNAIHHVRHLFLDADGDGPAVLAAIRARSDLPEPSYVLHTSPNRLHVLWRIDGFSREQAEAVQKRLARELTADIAATSCVQLTRLPGFLNTKYLPSPMVRIEYGHSHGRRGPSQFPEGRAYVQSEPKQGEEAAPNPSAPPRTLDRARRYIATIPPAVKGQRGDLRTFRVCCRLVRGFALSEDDAMEVISAWNRTCEPPWNGRELRTKLRSALKSGREPIGALRHSGSSR